MSDEGAYHEHEGNVMSHVHHMLAQQSDLKALLQGIDRGIHDHLAWNQKLMRCALMHDSPGDDMLRSDAHQCCQFGQWFVVERCRLEGFDEVSTKAVDRSHRLMHAAVRAACVRSTQADQVPVGELRTYEVAQMEMVDGLNALRQRVMDAVMHIDSLTGLPLRNGLEYAFQLRQKDATRQGAPLYLAMLDVDFFKRINDTWGHPAGDLALQHLARLMTACLRDSDIAVRYGGEEFLLLLLGYEAEKVIQRILEEVRKHPLQIPDAEELTMTITAGLTPVAPADSLVSAVARADRALLTGKHSGRDRCVLTLL